MHAYESPASLSFTPEWLRLFPHSAEQFHVANPGAQVVFTTVSEVINEFSLRPSSSWVYVVYSHLPGSDIRYLADYLMLPLLEPSSSNEFSVMLAFAIKFSLTYNISVFIGISNHSTIPASVHLAENESWVAHFIETLPFPHDYAQLSTVAKTKALEKLATSSPFNNHIHGDDKTLGIIACGNVCEALIQIPQITFPILMLKHYPLSRELAEPIYYACDEIIVLEQGRPYIEHQIRGIMGVGTRIRGKLNQIVPPDEIITPQLIQSLLNL